MGPFVNSFNKKTPHYDNTFYAVGSIWLASILFLATKRKGGSSFGLLVGFYGDALITID